jgi:hypothetical protein
LVGAGLLACLPLILSAGIVYAKFGQLDFPANSYRNPTGEVRAPIMGACKFEFGPHAEMLPTNLFAYLRPDAVQINPGVWPPINFRFDFCVGPNSPTYLWPLTGGPPGPLYVEQTTSLPNTMPIPLIATACFIVFAVRRKLWVHLLILAGLGTMGLSAAATMGMTSRYLGDFYPLLAVGLAFSAVPLSQLTKRSSRAPFIAVTSLLTAWSLVVNPSLFYWYARIYW